MLHLTEHLIQCPYCWEPVEVVVDMSVSEQTYIEDCFVCCQPILLNVLVAQDGQVSIDVDRENPD